MICAATRQEHCFSDEYTLFNARQMLSTAPRLPCLLGQQLSQHLLRGLSGQGYESHTDTDLTGHTYCVTGSTSGIGNTTALLLAQQGATVLVHGRDPAKVRKLLRTLKETSGNRSVYGYAYDLSSMQQTASFAAHLRKDLELWFGGRLNVLVNNAACLAEDLHVTQDGLERTWAVNVAAPFLLTGRLLDLCSDRILNVSSISMAESLDLGRLEQQGEAQEGGIAAYSTSKLALAMATQLLAQKMEGTSVTVNSLDPGTITTKLCIQGWGPVAEVALPVQEAEDEFWAATSPDLAAVTGQYLVNRKPRQLPAFAQDEANQQRVWDLLQRQTGCTYHIPGWHAAAQ